ncbi:neopentalenolactone/pentalenolactone F synthase [Kitasatospora sp. SUK 42]|uniref:neopentalenolactone/pentalenolactone F synthase n=1 Tax=Kitasatospora sp. SUK 42 TaxID=1588882 RepID=UPI0018C9F578|nr:TauD/TfdA family dioxygenase [Kitasatospora sp. SUK 42]MBV2156771.1 TauD/TfdA family dioxygenase [Kitasatospora sp. SUK 42]
MPTTVEITPIPGAPLGAVVHGAELSGDLDDTSLARILDAVDQHLVLVFRGHRDPTDEQLLAFGRRFGHIPKTGLTTGANPVHNEILIISNILVDGKKIGIGDAAWMDWHTDYSFRPRVSQLGVLAAVELPPSGGGQTLFTDMYAAYDSLPGELRARLHTYRARHALRSGYEDTIEEEYQGEVTIGATAAIQPEDGTATVHPVIARNPRTGRHSVYVNPLNTKRILELDPAASKELLQRLWAFPGTPELTYRHTWEPGDIVLWDQLGTLHAKTAFDPDERRMLRKVVAIFDDPVEPWRAWQAEATT